MTTLRNLKQSVTRLVKAEIANSWAGGGYAEDIPAIEQELQNARAAYERQCEILMRIVQAGGSRPDFRGIFPPVRER